MDDMPRVASLARSAAGADATANLGQDRCTA